MQVNIENGKTSDSLNVLKFDLDSHNLIGTPGILFHCVYINYRAPHKQDLKENSEKEQIKGNKDNGYKNSIERRQTGLEQR